MSISFDDNEQILFKCKATYNSKNGEIVVTSLRFAWVSGVIADNEFQTAWANIQNIKYSPADDPKERVMAMIQMVAGSGTEKPPVFHLTGPTKQSCRIELERLKTVVANVRKGKAPDNPDAKNPKTNGQTEVSQGGQIREKKRSRTQMTIDKNSVEYCDSVAMIEKKKDLLAADKLLGKQYKELVEVSKLLTPEDFWDNYASQHQQFLPDSKKNNGASSDIKGMLSVMLMDVEGTKNPDGSRRIDLTKEKRDQIFLMYPAVRKAFEAEVPLNKTETDFWVAYFQSEYFARDKGGRASAGDDSFGRTDDMFSRYEERLGESKERRGAPSSSSSSSAPSAMTRKNLTGLVGSDVDLTAVLGDFGPSDASNLEVGSGLSKNKAIVDKYNRFSQMFMRGKAISKGSGIGSTDPRMARRADEHSELNKEPEPAYLPLHLGMIGGVAMGEPIKEEEEGVSAFAKSAFAVKKSTRELPPPQSHMTPHALLSGLHSVFPTPQKALSCFHADIRSLDALSVLAQKAAISAGESVGSRAVVGNQIQEAPPPSANDVAGIPGGVRISGPGSVKTAGPSPSPPTVLDLTGNASTSLPMGTETEPSSSAPEGSELGEAFKQEMMEMFTLVTEFSRHFYAMLNREGSAAPMPNTPAAEKIVKIVGRLSEYGDTLSRKKSSLMAQDRDAAGSASQRRVASSVTVINEILKLIARANMKWETFQKASAGLNHQ